MKKCACIAEMYRIFLYFDKLCGWRKPFELTSPLVCFSDISCQWSIQHTNAPQPKYQFWMDCFAGRRLIYLACYS